MDSEKRVFDIYLMLLSQADKDVNPEALVYQAIAYNESFEKAMQQHLEEELGLPPRLKNM